MSDYAWPSTMDVTSFEPSLVPNVRQMWSPLAGQGQVADLLGERWRFRVGVPQSARLAAGYTEAFVNSLKGGANRALLWHMAREAPLGTLRGSPTLNGAHAQGASSIVLAAAYPGVNMLRFTQEFDNAAWAKSGASISANAAAAPDGTTAGDRIIEDTAAAAQHGVSQNVTLTGQQVTFSVYVKQNGRTWIHIRDGTLGLSNYFDIVSGVIGSQASGHVSQISDAGNGWWRCSVTFTAAVGVQQFLVRATTGNGVTSYTGDGTSGVFIWGAQVELGATPSPYVGFGTLLPGDMLGLNGMLLQVAAPGATADAAGAMTVPLVTRLRKACTTGLAVTWDKPTAPFKLTETGGIPVRHSGRVVSDLQLEFLEDY
jgi:hypothetical protein